MIPPTLNIVDEKLCQWSLLCELIVIELPLVQLTGRLSGVLSGIVLPIVRLHLKKITIGSKKKKSI